VPRGWRNSPYSWCSCAKKLVSAPGTPVTPVRTPRRACGCAEPGEIRRPASPSKARLTRRSIRRRRLVQSLSVVSASPEGITHGIAVASHTRRAGTCPSRPPVVAVTTAAPRVCIRHHHVCAVLLRRCAPGRPHEPPRCARWPNQPEHVTAVRCGCLRHRKPTGYGRRRPSSGQPGGTPPGIADLDLGETCRDTASGCASIKPGIGHASVAVSPASASRHVRQAPQRARSKPRLPTGPTRKTLGKNSRFEGEPGVPGGGRNFRECRYRCERKLPRTPGTPVTPVRTPLRTCDGDEPCAVCRLATPDSRAAVSVAAISCRAQPLSVRRQSSYLISQSAKLKPQRSSANSSNETPRLITAFGDHTP